MKTINPRPNNDLVVYCEYYSCPFFCLINAIKQNKINSI